MALSVKNVIALYAAVNNFKNAGQKIILAPGTYALDPAIDSTNGGRLELQEGMELHGQIAHPELVIIDISGLPPTSYAPSSGFPNRTGAIRLGKGNNKLIGLTVMGKNDLTNKTSLSIIDTDLTGQGSATINISNCIVEGGRIGINVRNVQAAHNFRTIEVILKNNVIRNNLVSDPGTQQGQGIVLQNANGVSNASITATLQGNHLFGNTVGLRIFNNSNSLISDTNNNTITITSKDDIIEKNKLGIYVGCGLNNGGPKKIDGNSIFFDAIRAKVQNNIGIIPDPIVLPSGIFVTGVSTGNGNKASNNKILIKLADCIFSGNQDVDIRAFGAFTRTNDPVAQSMNLPSLPGTFNIVKIELLGKSQTATRKTTNCFPPENPPTNQVVIIP